MATGKARVKNLKNLRKNRGLTQEKLAADLGVSRVSLCRWESGDFQPSLDELIAMARYFGVSLDDLVGVSGEGGASCLAK